MLDILYEDNHLLAVNKPAGLLTQPSGTTQDSLEAQAKNWIKTHYKKPGNVYLHAVHRLDKAVSGIVLFAKTSKALSRLSETLRNKEAVKLYWAVLEGKPLNSEGVLEDYLLHDDFQARIVDAGVSGAKKSRLSYRVLRSGHSWSLIEVNLETGRYHQIRVQLSAAGWPILGDRKYGSKHQLHSEAIALHHRELRFSHPVSKMEIVIIAEPPSYFELSIP